MRLNEIVDGIAQGSAKALFALHDMRVGSKAARKPLVSLKEAMDARRAKSLASGETAIRFDWHKNTLLIWPASLEYGYELHQRVRGMQRESA